MWRESLEMNCDSITMSRCVHSWGSTATGCELPSLHLAGLIHQELSDALLHLEQDALELYSKHSQVLTSRWSSVLHTTNQEPGIIFKLTKANPHSLQESFSSRCTLKNSYHLPEISEQQVTFTCKRQRINGIHINHFSEVTVTSHYWSQTFLYRLWEIIYEL